MHNTICDGHHYYGSIIIIFLYILLQATFASPHLVDSVITQGLDNTQQWVTKYKIEYSEDCVHYQQLQHPKVGVNLEVIEVGLHQWVLVNTRGQKAGIKPVSMSYCENI
jgi:hypothetical protein